MSKVKDDDDHGRSCPGGFSSGGFVSSAAAPVNDHGNGNAGGANADFFASAQTGLTEDNLGKVILDVLANDDGPRKASLWALDDGISALQRDGQGHVTPTDLLHQDWARSEAGSTDQSLNGARIWITNDGKVGYDASTLSDSFKAQLQHLQAGQYLTDSFTYATCVGDGRISWTTATVQFAGVNDAPVAVDDGPVTTAINTTINAINVLANDSDPDGDTLSVTGASALHGTISINGNGTLDYTPNGGYAGSDTITYAISDGHGGTANAHVAVTITGTVSGAVNDNATTAEDTAVGIQVLANDSFSSTPAISALGLASHGTVSINNAGTPGNTADDYIVYTPNADFNGSDSFTYTVTAGGSIQTATVFVTVTDVNDAPVTQNDSLSSVAEDSGMRTIAFSTLTGNDSAGPANESGQSLTITNVSNAVGGTVAIVAGHIEFTPTADFNGTASFDYTVTDNGTTNGASDPKSAVGHASFTVTDVNDAPVATNDVLSSVAEDSGVRAIAFSALTGNDSAGPANESAQALSVTNVSNAVGGTVAIVAGHIEFTPTADFNGAASFDYTVTDNGTTNGAPDPQSAVGHASFVVTEVNDAPVTQNDSLSSVAEDSGMRTIAFSTLTGNDSAGPANESGQTLTVTNVSNAVGGTVAIVAGHIEFTPTADFNGAASFDYTVTDNGTTNGAPDPQSAVGHASFVVTEVNDAPAATDDVLSSIAEDSGVRTIAFSELTANDSAGPSNESGQALSVTNVTNAVGGTVAIVAGHIEFTPAADFNGTASFDYTVSDNGTTNGVADPKSAVAHASFTVTEVNDAPVAVNDVLPSVLESSDTQIVSFATLLANDSPGPLNEAGQNLTITDVDVVSSVGCNVAIVNGHIEIDVFPSFTGTASFQYTVSDDGTTNGLPDPKTAVGTASFTVLPDTPPAVDLNGPAVGQDGAASFTEQTPAYVAPAATVTDVDSPYLTWMLAWLSNRPDGNAAESLSLDPTASAAAIAAGLTVSYTPTNGQFWVTGSASATVYQTILDGLQYNDTSDNPSTANRKIVVQVNDNVYSSAAHNTFVSVTPVNDPPVVDLNGAAAGNDATATFSSPAAIAIAPAATIADPDSANIAWLHATLNARPDGDAFESLSLSASAATTAAGSGLAVSYDASTGLLSVTGSASKATYAAILDGIMYNDTAATHVTTDRIVDVVINDGVADSIPHHVTMSGFVF